MIPFEKIKKLIPEETSGYYVNYDDNLSGHLSKVQECIHLQSTEPLDDIFEEWFPDYDYAKEELISDIQSSLQIEEDVAEDIYEYHQDKINDLFNERDTSTPLNDLFRNTSKQTMFYDTGYYIKEGSWNWSIKEINKERESIKRILGIRKKDEALNAKIDMMISQASYGGKLVIYFYSNVDDYISIQNIEKIKYIQFYNPHIAIIDVNQGSGDNTHIGKFTVKFPFNPENIFICSTFKYSYTHSVCGMVSNWCDDTIVSFKTDRFRRKFQLITSTYNEHFEKEKKLNDTYKKGSCTTGDMDISRHRNTTYINEYPCGNKCLDCGTFWID